MKDEAKTKKQLIEELATVRQRLSRLEETNESLVHSEKELRKSHEQKQSLLENIERGKSVILDTMTELVLLLDTNMKVIRANSATYRQFHLHPGQLEGKFCYEMLHQLNKPCKICPALKVMETGIPQTVEDFSSLGKRWTLRAYPVWNEEGNLVGIVETVSDITERKQAEDRRRESEERYRSLMENAPIGFCLVDISGNIQYINKKIEEVSGYSRDELIGLNGFTANLFSEESTQLLAERLAFRIEGRLPRPNEIEVPFICKDGTQIWIEINTTVLKKDGVPIGVQLAILDITERKLAEEALRESEELYKTLSESSFAAVFIIQDGKFVFINTSAITFAG